MYRIIDSRGRVYLPKELRLALDLGAGNFVRLTKEYASAAAAILREKNPTHTPLPVSA